MRLRVAWGGGAARQWLGRLQVPGGTLAEVRGLGLEADSPGSLVLSGDELQVQQRSARTYDGFDILVTAPADAHLVMELAADAGALATQRIDVPLADLRSSHYNEPLDERDNRLLIRRAPGDRLRVHFQRDALVFSPGETFSCSIEPHLISGVAHETLRLHAQLLPHGRQDDAVWSEQLDVRLDAGGSAPATRPLPVAIPRDEGVYDLVISLRQRRLTAPLVPSRLVEKRIVQLVVIDPQPLPASDADWETVAEIDPAKPGWWERLTRLPTLKLLPGTRPGPMGNGLAQNREHAKRSWVELKEDGWQAYPLPVAQPGSPHILEIEYPGDLPQTLGISVVEPNAAGQVVPIGLDSGVDVPDEAAADASAPQRHRLVFWPRTRSPIVLLTNRRHDRTAVFGRIRVQAGPDQLPAASLDESPEPGRLLMAYFDKPLFPENFSAPESLDEITGRSLDDWGTFYEGGRRLVQYLKYAGYNAAIISVACEGSTIYPSRLLEPTPKYDTGVFFATGQDPVRKDVLEMLFRLFDREGLQLIPALQFATPLPALERLVRRGGAAAHGIELIGSGGTSWLEQHGARRGLAPYYNPLDPRVQQAMRDVVGELTERYSGHASFAGISLQLGPESYAQFPDEDWGYDDGTIRRFEEAVGVTVPGRGPSRYAQRRQFLQQSRPKLWLTWRATALARLHRQLQQDVAQRREGARLYLAGAELFSGRTAQSLLRPALPGQLDIADATLRLGIAPALYAEQDNVVLLRPQRTAPLVALPTQAVNLQLQQHDAVDQHFRRGAVPGSLSIHEPLTLALPSFDSSSPFGAENSHSWFVPHIPPSGMYNRRRFAHSIAALDSHVIVDGGWMLSLGQEEPLRDFVATYRKLPAEAFETVSPSDDRGGGHGVTLRRLARRDGTWLYLVNDAPWPADAEVAFRSNDALSLHSLGADTVTEVMAKGGRAVWKVRLKPWHLLAVHCKQPDLQVDAWQASYASDVESRLRGQIREVKGRVKALGSPKPLDVLANPGFEEAEDDQALAHWTHAQGRAISVTLDHERPHGGEKSLHLRSTGGVAWVRSEPFPVPRTGRLSVLVWLRIADPQKQPPLRLALEGAREDGPPYYPFVAVGASATPLKTDWGAQPYLFYVDDLPVGELQELRIGFDLMGPGEVWIDDVQVYDLWFRPHEQHELLKNIAVADVHLDEGKLVECQRFLEGYWARFLLRYVPAPTARLADTPRRTPSPPPDADATPPERSAWDRVKGLVPDFPFR